MNDGREMTIGEIQTQLQQILLDDHPLTLKQRRAIKSAIQGMGLLRRLDRGRQVLEESQRKSNGSNGAADGGEAVSIESVSGGSAAS